MVNTNVWTDRERYYFTVYRNSERYEDGARLLFCDELGEYTFFPYAGGLKTIPEYCKNSADFGEAALLLWVERDKRFEKMFCKVMEEKKRIYITEAGFNRYWGMISTRIPSQDSCDLTLLTSPGKLPYVNEKGRIDYKSREIDIEVQRQVSRRANAMNDNKIRFVYAKSDHIVHDKTCRIAEQIPYWDFGALEDLPKDWELCKLCQRKIFIREAMGKDRKHFPWYLIFFNKGHVGNSLLEHFLHEGQAKIYMPMVDEMEIKYKEDTWRIEMNRKEEFILYHNNYEMLDDKERCITDGFHEQKFSPNYLAGILGYIEGYDWRKHLGIEVSEELVTEMPEKLAEGMPEKMAEEPVKTVVELEERESTLSSMETELKEAWWSCCVKWMKKIWKRKFGAAIEFCIPEVYTKYIHEGGYDMQSQIKSWGNSQGVRIPKEILKKAGIALNDIVDITSSDGTIILTKQFKHKTLEERAAEYGGQLNLDGEYDWGTPIGREVW